MPKIESSGAVRHFLLLPWITLVKLAWLRAEQHRNFSFLSVLDMRTDLPLEFSFLWCYRLGKLLFHLRKLSLHNNVFTKLGRELLRKFRKNGWFQLAVGRVFISLEGMLRNSLHTLRLIQVDPLRRGAVYHLFLYSLLAVLWLVFVLWALSIFDAPLDLYFGGIFQEVFGVADGMCLVFILHFKDIKIPIVFLLSILFLLLLLLVLLIFII